MSIRRLPALVFFFSLFACSKDAPPAPAPTTAVASASASAAAPAKKDGELAVGSPAPEFAARAHDGTEISIAALKGKPIVVYFYPKDETPGCTKEACAFRDAWKDLAATNVVLVGVSSDSADSHKKFAEHHKLPFHLVSDADGAIAKAYGVPTTLGYVARQTFVIGADGKLKKIYRTVDVGKHASEVLADVKS